MSKRSDIINRQDEINQEILDLDAQLDRLFDERDLLDIELEVLESKGDKNV